mgnify:CR=1 FL=1
MRIENFEWDETNRRHLTRHRVDPEEAEEVFVGRVYLRRTHSGRYLAYGKTLDGRYLLVVFELRGTTARVVTARDMTPKEKRLYRRRVKQ